MESIKRILTITKYEVIGRRNTFILITLISVFSTFIVVAKSGYSSSLLMYFTIKFLTIYVSFYPNDQYQINNITLKELCLSRFIQVSFFLVIWVIPNLFTYYTIGLGKHGLDLTVIILYSYTLNLVYTVVTYGSGGYYDRVQNYQRERAKRKNLDDLDDVKRKSLKWNGFYQISFVVSLLVIPFFFDTFVGPILYKYGVLSLIIVIFIVNIIYVEKVHPEVDR